MRLTRNHIRRIVNESVNRILMEGRENSYIYGKQNGFTGSLKKIFLSIKDRAKSLFKYLDAFQSYIETIKYNDNFDSEEKYKFRFYASDVVTSGTYFFMTAGNAYHNGRSEWVSSTQKFLLKQLDDKLVEINRMLVEFEKLANKFLENIKLSNNRNNLLERLKYNCEETHQKLNEFLELMDRIYDTNRDNELDSDFNDLHI